MPVNCRDWSPLPGSPHVGDCRAGVYPRPSSGACRRCPRRRPVDPAAAAVTPPADPTAAAFTVGVGDVAFRLLWDEVHAAADPSLAWWTSVVARLGCDACRLHTIAYATAHRPPFGDRAAFRAWGWELHNDVRRRQGKPAMTWDEFDRLRPAEGGSTGR